MVEAVLSLESFRFVSFDALKRAAQSFLKDDGFGLADEMAYNFLLALFPFLLFLAATAAFVEPLLGLQNLFGQAFVNMQAVLPAQATGLVRGVVSDILRTQSLGLLSFGILGALWAASRGSSALIKVLNRAYEVEDTRPFWQKKLLAVGLAVLIVVLVLAALVLYLLGFEVGLGLASLAGQGSTFGFVWNMLRWPLIVLFLLFVLALSYHVAPNAKQQFRWITPGSVLATAGWFLITAGFSYYVSHFSSYGRFYGSIGAVIVLMLWLDFTSIAILAGAELNAELNKHHDPVYQHDRERKRKAAQQEQPGVGPRSGSPAAKGGHALALPLLAIVVFAASMLARAVFHPLRRLFQT